MSCLREACGVVGAAHPEHDVVEQLWRGLLAVQHRGQEGNGIFTLDRGKFHHAKYLGLVGDLSKYRSLKGSRGIGHVRYTTTGSSPLESNLGMSESQASESFVQPFFVSYPKSGLALCHNGNLVNYVGLRHDFLSEGRSLVSDCDAEIILNQLARELASTKDLERSVANTMSSLEGAYSVVAVTGENELIAFRDPCGFRPLCYGKRSGFEVFSSESVALDAVGVDLVGDVKPGEMIVADRDCHISRKVIKRDCRVAHCMFEYVYFSRPDSVIEGKGVYQTRIRLGQNLAKTYKADADVVVPVPDTARPAAEGIARSTGIEIAEGLIKNRYIGRTFIMPGQGRREDSVVLKLNPVKSILKDKRVILVDDSIVRGTTSRKIVDLVRIGGAARVELWITCPPIISPCFYGIDISTHEELIAAAKSVSDIERTLGVDKLCYQTRKGLVDAIGFDEDSLCMACLTGTYPTSAAQQIADEMKGKLGKGKGRYWERELER